ncbi:hypothetical protein ABIE78_003933 [Sinorhizobium fredii]|uniref:Uncharacterized protein n=1 Tax=Sinorhizobium fredii (strain USDA 257) TaxID=1185652 RepID=I3X313_SINF2|nr:hypothetical protein [Sinorhizobium fredii]AFL50269.1 hypothetical protein USDA257_c16810 [Sinorhizobium fredii USDA 257]
MHNNSGNNFGAQALQPEKWIEHLLPTRLEPYNEGVREMLRDMAFYKKIIAAGVVGLAFVGVFDALKNLPVVSGCTFYGRCSQGDIAEPPTDLGFDPVAQ